MLVEALHARLDKSIFPAVVSICKEAGTTNSCFESGQVVVSGAKTELHALLSAHLLIGRISHDLMRNDLHIQNFAIQNIVSSCYLGFQLNLDAFASDNIQCYWEPDSFAGAHWKVKKGVSFVLFTSGKIVSTGQKTLKQVAEAEKLLMELKKYELGKEYKHFEPTHRKLKKQKLNNDTIADTPLVNSYIDIKDMDIFAE
jgi:TATA-box binding protein (TBP) (component of TFIID and TFIIIB)